MKKVRTRKGPDVKINGRVLPTRIYPRGVQRLPCNRWLEEIMRERWNEMAIAVAGKHITKEEARFIYQHVGYSVCGYAEVFPEDRIVNPLWEKASKRTKRAC